MNTRRFNLPFQHWFSSSLIITMLGASCGFTRTDTKSYTKRTNQVSYLRQGQPGRSKNGVKKRMLKRIFGSKKYDVYPPEKPIMVNMVKKFEVIEPSSYIKECNERLKQIESLTKEADKLTLQLRKLRPLPNFIQTNLLVSSVLTQNNEIARPDLKEINSSKCIQIDLGRRYLQTPH